MGGFSMAPNTVLAVVDVTSVTEDVVNNLAVAEGYVCARQFEEVMGDISG